MATIKLTNGVLLDFVSLKVGIDPTNVIATGSLSTSQQYKATADGWMTVKFGGNGYAWVNFDNTQVAQVQSGNRLCIPMKKDQIMKVGDTCNYTFYGTK